MARHKSGIELAEGYKKSFASFKKELGHVEYFLRTHPDQREQVMMETYEELTGKKAKPKKSQTDGKLPDSTEGSKGSKSPEGK